MAGHLQSVLRMRTTPPAILTKAKDVAGFIFRRCGSGTKNSYIIVATIPKFTKIEDTPSKTGLPSRFITLKINFDLTFALLFVLIPVFRAFLTPSQYRHL